MSNLTTSIQVKLYINPPDVPEFLAAVERIIAFANSVPEFISFTLYHKPEAPGEFSYIEHWAASKEFVNILIQHEKVQEYFAATEKMYIKPKEAEIWTLMKREE